MLGKTAFLPEVEVLLTEESHCNSTRHTQRYPQRLEETYSQELVASWLNSLHGPGLSFSSSLNVVSQAQLKHGRQELTAARDDKPKRWDSLTVRLRALASIQNLDQALIGFEDLGKLFNCEVPVSTARK